MVGQWGGCGDEGVSAMRRKAPASAVRRPADPVRPSACQPVPRPDRSRGVLGRSMLLARRGARPVLHGPAYGSSAARCFPTRCAGECATTTDARSPRQVVPLSRPMDDANAAVRVRQWSSRPRGPGITSRPGQGHDSSATAAEMWRPDHWSSRPHRPENLCDAGWGTEAICHPLRAARPHVRGRRGREGIHRTGSGNSGRGAEPVGCRQPGQRCSGIDQQLEVAALPERRSVSQDTASPWSVMRGTRWLVRSPSPRSGRAMAS